MPSAQAHRQQAEHNRKFIDFLDVERTEYLDWVVTAIFYTALHWVSGLLVSKGLQPCTHAEREDILAKLSETRPIYKDYYELKFYSIDSRYNCVSFDRRFVKETLLSKLARIERLFQKS